MASKMTITKCLALLCEAFNRDYSALAIEAYSIGLDGLTDDEVLQAAKLALQGDHQFMPSPGTLRSLVRSDVEEKRRRRKQQIRNMLSSDANQATEYDGKSIADMFRDRHGLN